MRPKGSLYTFGEKHVRDYRIHKRSLTRHKHTQKKISAGTTFPHSDPKVEVHGNTYDYPSASAICSTTTYQFLCRNKVLCI